jgi:hypothetical protein
MGLRMPVSFMVYAKLPILIFRVYCLASCLCVISKLRDNSLLFRSRPLILHKQSVRHSSIIWFVSLSVSGSRHSSYNLKVEIRIPVASEISTAVFAHRCKAVTVVDPYISKNTESFSRPVRCTALNKKLTRHWYFYVQLIFSVPSYMGMIRVIS